MGMVIKNSGRGTVLCKDRKLSKAAVSREFIAAIAGLQEILVMQVGETFPVGSRVRVAKSVVVYHHPEHRNQAFDIQGQEGEIVSDAREWQGKPISANFPYVVKFGGKFKVHLQPGEIEIIP